MSKKKMRLCVVVGKTFEEGVAEYILDCKARNLRNGTINHYLESVKQIYKRIPAETPIADLSTLTMPDFIIALRDDPNINEVSMGTYARDLKTLMRFFMKCEYLPYFEIKIPKTDKQPIETYTDAELKQLLRKPDVRKCNFATYAGVTKTQRRSFRTCVFSDGPWLQRRESSTTERSFRPRVVRFR